MALLKRGRPRKMDYDEMEEPHREGEDATNRPRTPTSLATTPEIADRVRALQKKTGVTLLELNDKLLLYALEHATIEVERPVVKICPKDVLHQDTPTPTRGRRKRKT